MAGYGKNKENDKVDKIDIKIGDVVSIVGLQVLAKQP